MTLWGFTQGILIMKKQKNVAKSLLRISIKLMIYRIRLRNYQLPLL
nr:MAG TPA: hypothetical protein [Crassvirales sp.]